MSKTPPERIDPAAAAEKGRSYEGRFPIARMERLGDMVLEHSGDVSFRLRFGREGSFSVVRGRVMAELTLECQCCLSALKLPIDQEFSLGIVSTLCQGTGLPESLEPLVVGDEGSVSLVDLIEDELILSVPHVPQHEVCAVQETAAAQGDRLEPARTRAFAGLSSLIDLNKTVG